jgi:hypothetical protein
METTLPTPGTSADFLLPVHLEGGVSQNLGASTNLSTKSDRSFGNTLTTVLSWNFAATLIAVLLETILGADTLPARLPETSWIPLSIPIASGC